MKIAVISDLHIGAGGRVDRFGHEEASFLRFLDFLAASFERVVVLGDALELLHGPRPGAYRAQVEAIRAARPRLFQRLMAPPFTYVHGNHDLAAGRLLGAPSELLIEAGDARVLLLHGHQGDFIVRHAYPVAAFLSWVGGMVERVVGPRLARWLDDVDHLVTSPKRTVNCPFQQWAVAQAHRHAADVVVTGHTHVPVVAEHGDRVFMNSGTCSRGRFDFLAIDTATGTFQHHERW